MNKILKNIIALAFLALAGIYLIPQESISLFEYCLTFIFCLIGALFLDTSKTNEAVEKEGEK